MRGRKPNKKENPIAVLQKWPVKRNRAKTLFCYREKGKRK